MAAYRLALLATAAASASATLRVVATGLAGPSALSVLNATHLLVATLYDGSVVTMGKADGSSLPFAGVAGSPGPLGHAPTLGAAASTPLLFPAATAMGAGVAYFTTASGYVLSAPASYAAPALASITAGSGVLGYAGDGAAATSAALLPPTALAVASTGDLMVGDASGHVRRVSVSKGTVATILGSHSSPLSTGCFPPPALSSGGGVTNGDGGVATSAVLGSVTGMAFEAGGALYVADGACGLVRRMSATGVVTTAAGVYAPYAEPYSAERDEAAPATDVGLDAPAGVVVTAGGHLIIAERGCVRLVRKCDAAIVTLAGTCGQPGWDVDAIVTAAAATGTVDPLAVLLARPSGLVLAGATAASQTLYIADAGLGAVFAMPVPTLVGCPSPSPIPSHTGTHKPKPSSGAKAAAAGTRNGATRNGGTRNSGGKRGVFTLCGHGGRCWNSYLRKHHK